MDSSEGTMPEKLPVAEYLRMSTEHQKYSFENQQAVIAEYADNKDFNIVQIYTDGARSGVVIKRRDGLKQLIQDVKSGKAVYKAILVFDVSRWGRFQDTDESAYYEFICKQNGIPVHYCAEPFLNDGTPISALIKSLKRTMAGEYSRELGVKVLAGLKLLARLGFKQGGTAGYGLRRMLLSTDGQRKQLLAYGERKSLATERVVLVPGPEEEIALVREIYRMFVEDGICVKAIARQLNERGVSFYGSRWSHHSVQQILSHPKYIGCHVFNRTTQKLGTPSVRRPQSEWVLTPGAFEPIVSEEMFNKANAILLSRTSNKTDNELLESLRRLLKTHGKLTYRILETSTETASPTTFLNRFGSLRRAYELIGYGRPSDYIELRHRARVIKEQVMRNLQDTFPDKLTIVRQNGRWMPYIRMKNGRLITVLIARSKKAKVPIWQMDPVPRNCHMITLLVLLNENNSTIREMHLFNGIHRTKRFAFKKTDPWLKTGLRVPKLSDFYELVTHIT
jgi:DNA invertase Pin-like site-specific DNA recombinase